MFWNGFFAGLAVSAILIALYEGFGTIVEEVEGEQ